MAAPAPEFVKDLEELRSLRSTSVRPSVQRLLDAEISRVEALVAEVAKREALSATTSSTVVRSSADAPLPTVKLTNFGWDQSDKFVKLYITLNGVQEAPSENLQKSFGDRSFSVLVRDFNGKNHEFSVVDLAFEIVPEESVVKQKTDSLLVMLKKKQNKQWDGLTKLEQQAKQKSKDKFKMDESADPQASIMNLMKQMYDEGDDDMKRSIKQAWQQAQSKKGMEGLTDF